MKLFELIDTQFHNTKSDIPHQLQGRIDRSKAGKFAYVEPDEDEHMINKKYHSNLDEYDPYIDYIKAISDSKIAQSNPYFPRVYNVNFVKDLYGDIKPTFKMEKLTPLKDCDPSLIYNLAHNIINIDINKEPPGQEEYYPEVYLATLISEISESRRYSFCKDPKLAEALKFINHMVDKLPFKVSLDLHEGNFMIRFTKYGPQLVIIDPVYFNKWKNLSDLSNSDSQ